MTTPPRNTHPGWGPLRQDFTANPRHYQNLRNGCLWLYLYLISHVHPRTGKLVTTWTEVAADTNLSREHVRSMAGHLKAKGYALVQNHGPDQVLFALTHWVPAFGDDLGEAAPAPRTPEPQPKRPPRKAAPSPLAGEIAEALDAGEHLEAIEEIVTQYPTSFLRHKLEVALGVPEERIRVSRFALWRYLLTHENS